MTYLFALTIGALLGFVLGYAVRPSSTRTVLIHTLGSVPLPRRVGVPAVLRKEVN